MQTTGTILLSVMSSRKLFDFLDGIGRHFIGDGGQTSSCATPTGLAGLISNDSKRYLDLRRELKIIPSSGNALQTKLYFPT